MSFHTHWCTMPYSAWDLLSMTGVLVLLLLSAPSWQLARLGGKRLWLREPHMLVFLWEDSHPRPEGKPATFSSERASDEKVDTTVVPPGRWTSLPLQRGFLRLVESSDILCQWVLLCRYGLLRGPRSPSANGRSVGWHWYVFNFCFSIYMIFLWCSSLTNMCVLMWSRRRACLSGRTTQAHVEG